MLFFRRLPGIIFCFFSLAGFSQNLSLLFERINLPDEIAGMVIGRIMQDHTGYIWVASENGLIRYNGYDFKVYRHINGDTTSLSGNNVLDFVEGKDHLIYVATRNGLSVYHPATDHFENYYHDAKNPTSLPANVVTCLCKDGQGTIWGGTEYEGFFRFDAATRKFRSYRNSLNGMSSNERARSNNFNQIISDKEGNIWLASVNGLWEFNSHTEKSVGYFCTAGKTEDYSRNNQLMCVALDEDDDNLIWTGTWGGGLHLFNRSSGEWKVFEFEPNAKYKNVTNIVTDIEPSPEHGMLWIAPENRGLISFDKKNFTFNRTPFNNAPSLSLPPSVHFIYKDQYGNFWFSRSSILYRLAHQKQQFTYLPLTIQPGTIHLLPDGHRLMMMNFYAERSLAVYDLLTGKFSSKRLPVLDEKPSEPSGIVSDKKGNFWICSTRGIYFYDTLKKEIFRKTYRVNDSVTTNQFVFSSAISDVGGNIWMAGTRLLRIDPATDSVTVFEHDNNDSRSVPYNGAGILAMDEDGNIWMNHSPRTISRYNWRQKNFTDYTDSISFLSDRSKEIRSMCFDKSNRLWMAVEGGSLLRVDFSNHSEKKETLISAKGGLPQGEIENIVCDKKGSIWGFSQAGLIKVNPETLELTVFTKSDGLPSDNLSGVNVAVVGDRIFFSAVSGLMYFNSDSLKPFGTTAPVVIQSVKVFNQEIDRETQKLFPGQITLDHDQNSLTIEFTAIEFNVPDKLQYACYLEGVDKDFSSVGLRRNINYSNLRPGKYSFQIKTSVDGKNWSDVKRKMSILILPAWWQTTLFNVALLALIAIAAFYTIRFFATRRLRQQLLEVERQKEIANIRSRMSRDIHDDIGSGLTKISMLANRMKGKVEDASLQEMVSDVENISREVTSNLGEIVWTINPQSDNVQSFVGFLRDYAVKFFDSTDKAVRFHMPETIPDKVVQPDTKRNLFLVFKEALNNILKHSGANEVTITVIPTENELQIEISDNGHGFEMDKEQKGNGLRNMQKRMESVNGSCVVLSSPKGTQISYKTIL